MSQAQGSGIPAMLRTLREYLAFYCGLGLLASASLLWSVLALPLSLVLPRKWKKTDGTTGYYHGLPNLPAGLIHYGGLPF